MIRVRKSIEVPQSLQAQNCNKYDSEDVKVVLYENQNGKCYLCEQKTRKSFEIEHFKAKTEGYYPELKFTWSNLFLSCPYCNGRKSNDFNHLLNPIDDDIEEIIEQRILFDKNRVEFESSHHSESIKQTICLLDKLLNGKSGIRDIKGQILYKDIERETMFFMELLLKYRLESNQTNKQAVIDCLHVSKEFLGIKFWIMKDNINLYNEFKSYLVWNKK
jgi:uncharacterized protein (TIGR02646 family)